MAPGQFAFCGLLLLLTTRAVDSRGIVSTPSSWTSGNSQNDQGMACRPGWTLANHDTMCYKVLSDSKLIYDEAKVTCEMDFTAHLAVVHKDDAIELAATLLPRYGNRYWIKTEQPDVFCQYLHLSSVGVARDRCSKNLGYICEVPAQNLTEKFAGCPKDSFGWKDRCYSIDPEPKDFNTSQADCEVAGGNLATVDSKEAFDYLKGELTDKVTPVWIGLHKDDDNVYTWKSGDKVEYVMWDRDHLGTELEKCVAIKPGVNEPYRREDCASQRPSLCELPRTNAHSPGQTGATKVVLTDCGNGWQEYGEFCYMVSDGIEQWKWARDRCMYEGGELASLHSVEEALFFKNVLFAQREHQTFWLGMNFDPDDFDTQDGLRWTDDTPFDYSNLVNSHNFHKAVEINPSSMEWAFVSMGEQRYYVCKKWRGISDNAGTTPQWRASTSPRPTATSTGRRAWAGYGTTVSHQASWTKPRPSARGPFGSKDMNGQDMRPIFADPKQGQESLNFHLGMLAAQRLNTMSNSTAQRARLAFFDILALAELADQD